MRATTKKFDVIGVRALKKLIGQGYVVLEVEAYSSKPKGTLSGGGSLSVSSYYDMNVHKNDAWYAANKCWNIEETIKWRNEMIETEGSKAKSWYWVFTLSLQSDLV